MAAAAGAGAGPYEEMLQVVEACVARIRWRLRPASKRRLLNDILFLCTGLRPVVLVDYGGTMPQLQENLCSLLHHARQETSILNALRVMIIGDMLYLIHVKGLAEHASPNTRSQQRLAFMDLEKRCCSLLTTIEDNDTVLELVSIQDQFAAKFPVDLPIVGPGITKQMSGIPQSTIDAECTDNHFEDRTLLVVDLSTFLENKQISLPSLNGWLLGYPVTYLFRDASSEAAIQNVTRHSLHIYRVYVCRSYRSVGKQSEEELMSFSVPCGSSTKRDEEVWAKSFIARMNEKLRRCNQVWASIRLEVEVFQSQSQVIVMDVESGPASSRRLGSKRLKKYSSHRSRMEQVVRAQLRLETSVRNSCNRYIRGDINKLRLVLVVAGSLRRAAARIGRRRPLPSLL
ncbi:unnamed protein product [Miscanthus lutarioriparius]|uniref:Uncharacterized protein n=1 Tax=Miscanthus lutarioriparius TaxID=422564 RepID=A0A811N9S7_9POAL|nr:unnamed protein product [Miscanthus lutarioriparius]